MRKLYCISILVVLICLGILIFLFISHDFASTVRRLINVETPPLLFIALMSFLPSLGFPISVFMVLLGLKFGIAGGLLIAALLIPIHMLISYLITHSFLRHLIYKALKLMNYNLPTVPADKIVPFTLIFMGIPGPPYALKNYILALSGVPFRYYLGLGWPINFLLGIPLVGLGGSAIRMNTTFFVIFFVLLLTGFFLVRWLRKKYASYRMVK